MASVVEKVNKYWFSVVEKVNKYWFMFLNSFDFGTKWEKLQGLTIVQSR